jgi:Uncharacterized conserved protein
MELRKMKVAIATEGSLVSEHFGRCENFTVYEVENGKVLGKELVNTQDHQRGALSGFLNELGVNVVLSGGAGAGAVQKLNQLGIELFTGIQGRIEDVLNSYLKGELLENAAILDKQHLGEHEEHNCRCGCHQEKE